MRVISPTNLAIAAHAIDNGELVIVPTRRWYMLCCDAANPVACRRIYAAKKRPTDKPLLLVVPSSEAAHQDFVVCHEAQLLIDAFWPGDLAVLLPWRDHADGEKYVAVGRPHALVSQAPDILGRLSTMTEARIAATSSNVSVEPGSSEPEPAITVDEVTDFVTTTSSPISIVIDGGVCPAAHHLTIVDCSTDTARLARRGLVHERAIATVLDRAIQESPAGVCPGFG